MCKECDVKPRKTKRFKNPQIWEPTKTCTRCDITKPKDEFRTNFDKRRDCKYKSAECLECLSNVKANDRDTVRGRSLQLARGSKARASKKGIEHTLTPEWIAGKLDKGVCEVTGTPFELKGGRKNGFVRSFTPSLDRTDPNKGYTPDNVKVVCWIYNSVIGRLT